MYSVTIGPRTFLFVDIVEAVDFFYDNEEKDVVCFVTAHRLNNDGSFSYETCRRNTACAEARKQ